MINKCCICQGEGLIRDWCTYLDIPGKTNKGRWSPKITVCKKCGFIWQGNPFTNEELTKRYSNNSKYEFDAKESKPLLPDNYIERCERQKNFIAENIGNNFNSILEIGSASGYNLSLYKKDNKIVYGIEPSEQNCKLAKKNYNVDMFSGMFSEWKAQQKAKDKYDLCFLSHVLEHIVNPYEFIEQCAEHCNYFFIEVPTLDYKYIDEPFGFINEEHVNLFTLQSLQALMNKAGFELINQEVIFSDKLHNPSGWPAISTLWEKSDNIKTNKRSLFVAEEIFNKYCFESNKLLKDVDKNIRGIPSKERLACFGAGRHLSMLLANTCLKKKNIIKIYDNDKRKSSLSFADIPVSSFSIDDLINNKIDSVLITSFVGQESILNFLKQVNEKIKIYCLY